MFKRVVGLVIAQLFIWTLGILALTSLVWSIKLLVRVWYG